MQEIHVNVYIHAPTARVFDTVSDHETFLWSEDGTRTTVTRPGSPERNGKGCLREVKVGQRMRYLEEITDWQRSSSFDYQIVETSHPIRHHGARVRFIPRGEGTEIDWTSSFEVTLPVVGRFLEPLMRRLLAAAFTELLLVAKAKLEATAEG